MDQFNYKQGQLYCEGVALKEIAATHGTPAFIYSRASIESQYKAFDEAFGDQPHQICYAVKANSNIAILNLLARLGSGFDIVSGGELERVIRAGGDPEKIIFSGVGKTVEEIEAALNAGIQCFNVESTSELERINEVARVLCKTAPVSIRVNPDVDAQTHPYISTGLKENKFGIDINDAFDWYRMAADMSNLEVVGIDCHIGSQLTNVQPFIDALDRVLALVEKLNDAGITLHHMDIGGGLGIRYKDETPPLPAEFASRVIERLPSKDIKIIIEPGRSMVANAGVLLSKVEFLKSNGDYRFAIVDAAMNDLIRPTLYQAWQDIVTCDESPDCEEHCYDVVGPICETGDFLGKQRHLRIEPGSLIAIRSAGAYGFVMSSNYNSRPRACELLVDQERCHVIRERETVAQLMQGEHLLAE